MDFRFFQIEDNTENREKNQRCKERNSGCKVWKKAAENVKIGRIFVKFGVDGKGKCVIIKKQNKKGRKLC